MKLNVGTTDKIIRILSAVIIIALFFAHIISGVLAAILLVVAGIFIVTGFINFCPIYFIFGLSSRKNNNKQ